MEFFRQSWVFFNEMSIYLLLGFFVAGILHIAFPDNFIYKHLGKSSISSVLKATLAGIPLPLCSCGVIPVAASIRKRGASKGATLSFLISTPQIGTDSFFITYSLIGWVFAVFRIIAAFITALFSGILSNIFAPDSKDTKLVKNESVNDTKSKKSIKSFFNYIVIELFGSIANYLLVGIIAAGLISVFIPDSFFELYFSSPFLSMLIMLIVGIPLYICATSSTPIAASLLLKGISPGAALVFLLAGPATNTATIATVLKLMGKKALAVYLFSISVTSIALGYLLNLVVSSGKFPLVMQQQHEMLPMWIKLSGSFIIILMFLFYYMRKIIKKKETGDFMGDIISLKVKGMTCQHCSESVRRAVESVEGASEVNINLNEGLVNFSADNSKLELIKKAIDDKGYEVVN